MSIEDFNAAIHRILKEKFPDKRMSISSDAVNALNDQINDTLKRIADEAARLAGLKMTSIITEHEIKAAVNLVFPDSKAKGAVLKGFASLSKYKEWDQVKNNDDTKEG